MKTLYVDFDEEKILANLDEVVPLFPLDNVVFFPNTVLPLHIFEERYKQMIEDSTNSNNLICMSLMYDSSKGSQDSSNIAKIGTILSQNKNLLSCKVKESAVCILQGSFKIVLRYYHLI